MTPEEKNRQYELQMQITELQEQLRPFEVKERQSTNSALVGRYFKYHNSYGSDESWWKYAKIVSVGEYWPIALSFQHTSRDSIEIETDKSMTSVGGWTEISQVEYEHAWQGLMQDVRKMAETMGIRTEGVTNV